MKITAPRDALLAAYTPAAAVAPSRSPKPILQSVKLSAGAGDDSCVFSATNLELGLRARALGVEVLDPGSAVLPPRFAAILRTAPAGCSVLVDAVPAASGFTLHVRAGSSRFELASEDPDLFPDHPEPPSGGSLEVPAADLARMVRRTIFACDEESTRYALGGTLVERDGENRLAVVGTDGRRLARQVGECRFSGDFPAPLPVVPVKAWKILLKHLDDGSTVGLAFDRTTAHVDAGAVKLWTRLVEGRFPRYQDVFPGKPSGVLTAEAGPLLSAFRQAEVCTSEESRGVDLKLAPGAVSLAATAADVGSSNVDVPAAYEGPVVALSLDVRYLVDVLAALDPALALKVEVVDHKTAAVIRTEDGYVYVVMPLARDR